MMEQLKLKTKLFFEKLRCFFLRHEWMILGVTHNKEQLYMEHWMVCTSCSASRVKRTTFEVNSVPPFFVAFPSVNLDVDKVNALMNAVADNVEPILAKLDEIKNAQANAVPVTA